MKVAPEGTICSAPRCQRMKNLWPYDWDGKLIWSCWPHHRFLTKRRQPPYRGRVKHHDYAMSVLQREDYPKEERNKHHEFARQHLG